VARRVRAFAAIESRYRPDAFPPAGAIGLMQLMPETALRYGVRTDDLQRPEINLRAGSRYLADLIRMFSGDLELALAGYNAGEWAVIKHGGRIPPVHATRADLPKILPLSERPRPRAAPRSGLAEGGGGPRSRRQTPRSSEN